MKRSKEHPVAPENAVKKELGIREVHSAIYRSGIAMANWGEVGNALITLRTGETDLPAYQAVIYTQGTYRTVAQRGYPHPVQTVRTDPPPPFMHGYVDSLLTKLYVQSRDYQRAVEEDTTTGTTITVTKLPEEKGLVLELDNSLGDDRKKEEDRLAKLLRKERSYSRGDVYVVLEPVDGQFSIDFDLVADRLSTLLPIKNNRAERKHIFAKKKTLGERMAEYFTSVDNQGSLLSEPIEPGEDLYRPFIVGSEEGLEVSLSLAMVGEPDPQVADSRWEADGAILTGPLLEDTNDKNYVYPPVLVISVHRPTTEAGQKTVVVPTVDPQMKDKIKDITSKIKLAFDPGSIIKREHA